MTRGSFRRLVYLLLVGLNFSGCVGRRQTVAKNTGMTCNVAHVSRGSLIIPTLEAFPVKQSRQKSSIHTKIFPESSPLSVLEQHQHLEAQLSDIAIPVMVKPVEASRSSTGGTLLTYQSTLTVKDLTEFYTKEMEQFGWRQQIHFEGKQVLLTFKKPGRFAAVSMKPVGKIWERSKKILLSLFIGHG